MKTIAHILVLMLLALACNESPTTYDNQLQDYRVAYFTDAMDSIYVVKIDGTQNYAKVKLAYRGVSIDWIPNTTSFVYSEFNSSYLCSVWKYDCNTGNKTRLIDSTLINISQIKVSPKGDKIACNYGNQIALFDIDGKNIKILTNIPNKSYMIQWSSNGQSLLYKKYRNDSILYSTIWSLDLQSNSSKMLSESSYLARIASYSPDGLNVAISLIDTTIQQSRLEVVSSNGEKRKYITPYGIAVTDPVWSPDGSNIAFIQEDPNHIMKVYLLNNTDLSIKQLSFEVGVHFYVKWVNNELVSFYTNGLYNLCVISKNGGAARKVTNIKENEAGGLFTYAISSIPF
jgi:Tol biopolymer transport system component